MRPWESEHMFWALGLNHPLAEIAERFSRTTANIYGRLKRVKLADRTVSITEYRNRSDMSFFSAPERERSAYLLGCYHGCGTFSTGKSQTQITMIFKDLSSAVEFVRTTRCPLPIRSRMGKYRVRFTNPTAIYQLGNLGYYVGRRKRDNAIVFDALSQQSLPHFMRGFLDNSSKLYFQKDRISNTISLKLAIPANVIDAFALTRINPDLTFGKVGKNYVYYNRSAWNVIARAYLIDHTHVAPGSLENIAKCRDAIRHLSRHEWLKPYEENPYVRNKDVSNFDVSRVLGSIDIDNIYSRYADIFSVESGYGDYAKRLQRSAVDRRTVAD